MFRLKNDADGILLIIVVVHRKIIGKKALLIDQAGDVVYDIFPST